MAGVSTGNRTILHLARGAYLAAWLTVTLCWIIRRYPSRIWQHSRVPPLTTSLR